MAQVCNYVSCILLTFLLTFNFREVSHANKILFILVSVYLMQLLAFGDKFENIVINLDFAHFRC